MATFDFGGAYDDLTGMSVGQDGKIWAVGTGGFSNRFAVARLLPDGQFDNSFSDDGRLIINSSAGSGGVQALPGGKALVGVPRLSPEPRGFQAIRLNDNGTFDSTFGVGGVGFIETPSQVRIEDLIVDSDGKVLVGGYDFFSGDWNFVVTRFNADGTPDQSFGTGGRVVTSFTPAGVQDNLLDLAILSDGRILAGGHSEYENALACYLPNGALDASFGVSGRRVFTLTGQPSALEAITDIYPLSDGKFLATSGVSGETALARFNSDGSLDDTFGVGGRILAPLNAPWRNPAAMTLDFEGRILLGNGHTLSVTRLLPDGSVDSSFGTNGTFDIDVGPTYRKQVTSLGWAHNGDLIVGGYSVVTANVDSNWHVARLAIGVPSPTQTINIAPTFDVKAIPGAVQSITEGETSLFIGLGFDAENPEERPIFEFPLVAVPEGATITAATLKLKPYVSSGEPRIEALGYAGDGLASISDITAPGEIVAITDPVSAALASIDIELSPEFIQSLLGTSSHLGLRLRSLNAPLYVGFDSTEAAFDTPPRLTITYTLPTVEGDFTGDGVVDGADLLEWTMAFGQGDQADFDEDGDSDGNDFLALQRAVSQQAGATASVPEPALHGLALVTTIAPAFFSIACLRRRGQPFPRIPTIARSRSRCGVS